MAGSAISVGLLGPMPIMPYREQAAGSMVGGERPLRQTTRTSAQMNGVCPCNTARERESATVQHGARVQQHEEHH